MIWMDVDIALASVPVNAMPLIDSTDFKTIEDAVVFNQAGLALLWHFTTTAGVTTSTAVTPTSGGDYDWTDQGTSGMYAIEIPASGGASANNNTEGFGWFTGVATGILPWAGPIIGFRAAGLNNALVDSAYSATRGLAGTAVPDAAADAAGGLPISDAGGLDLDARLDAAITSRLAPATPGRTLVVDANGLADANTVKVGPTGAGTAQTAGDIIGDTNDIQSRLPAALVGGRIDASVGAMAADVLTDAATAADFEAKIADVVWDEDATGHQTQGTFGQAIGDPVADTGTIYKAVVTDATGVTVGTDTATLLTRMGTPSDLGGGATLAGKLSDIEAQTDDIGAAGAGLTALPWNAAWDAEVQSEVDDALVAQRLDELVNADSDIDGAAPPTVGSVIHELMTKTAGSFTYDQSTDSLEAIRDKEADIETDTNELQADWVNGGRLDLILDIIAADVVNLDGAAMRGTDSAALASVCTEASLAELAAANLPADVDTLLTRLSAARALLLDEITAVRMATLTDWINGGRLDLILDIIAVDVAGLDGATAARMAALTDWIDGGRLDLLLDAILLDTGTTLDGRIPAALVCGKMD